MPKINLLPQALAELIAAGEVVERPASVVKELIENSIDAKAKRITVEIATGGISMIRITDDGCGIEYSDVPTAFLRHATSKIKSQDDLYSIASLGFRGEALAATASVSKIEMFTKTPDSLFGTHYVIEGGKEKLIEESGCPDGTTIVIRDIFYNTPARMKFLKKDSSEGAACQAVVERAALSHPEIAFKFIKEGKALLSTSGDGSLKSAVYSVLGREFAASLIEMNSSQDGISVAGYITKPTHCRGSRASQYTFLNGRLVRSGTVCAAIEQAYKNSIMTGKFPGFVAEIKVPYESVDVNVHPAKTEVRFADEKRIFDAVYYAAKSALSIGDSRPTITANSQNKAINRMSTEEYRQTVAKIPDTPAERAYKSFIDKAVLKSDNRPFFDNPIVKQYIDTSKAGPIKEQAPKAAEPEKIKPALKETEAAKQPPKPEIKVEIYEPKAEITYIGEAFSTYIVVQRGDSIYLIDKHAAHERIIFNDLKAKESIEIQPLLSGVTVRLPKEEHDTAVSNISLLEKLGFEIEDFGNSSIIVRAVPAVLLGEDVETVVSEAIASLCERGAPSIERLDRIYHTVACKAAIKAGMHTSQGELTELAKRVLESDDIMYCPHGRPVAFEIKRRELERQFGRIQ